MKPNSYDLDDDLPDDKPDILAEVIRKQEEYMRARLGEEVWKMLEKRT